MDISTSTNFNANITLKDANGNDTVVAYLASMLDSNSQNFNINVNVSNKTLFTTAGAINTVGETAQQQYTEFESAVKARAKELGFTIFE
ncbi:MULTISPECIES: hypothetical protein [Clostridium]|uniref:hypothetical protein n=1 Tax=Clostridium TaxID=1485 RepID=UPI00069F609D|nr:MULTISPECIES: hypothetical protein [Clostridium]KOF55790.1 hypothetical protein AGR56_18535 [Clostridium sp. DMHC 10]MCD2348477.1 hypothetical protein [Clostridium guangxiense]